MKFTRRKFLGTALGAPLVAGLGRWPLVATPLAEHLGGLLSAAEGERFPHPHVVRYDSDCFTIHDRDTFLFSASFHYPRCPEPLWRDRLMKLRRAGFNTIEGYVFWNYHEPEEGRIDLGEFERFVRLVGEMGFWMIARPGPYVCSEWDAGGFPHWVVAKQFPLRSSHRESVRTSRHWYDSVLPVIRRHQITRGGPILLMQLENEYDYWPLADADKRAYVTALAEMAWKAGIEVPLITCWTKQVRERGNAAMRRIADFCNFYPGWKVVKEVVPGLARLRREEPDSPVGVVELQGGWFSNFGGKLAVEKPAMGPVQLNLISKTTLEQGATFFNYYMGFGGTNFDWAAKGLTTTYDYAAPLREPGGLWSKYYAARGVGASLALLGNALTRAKEVEGCAATNPAVSVSLRGDGGRGALFVRENAAAQQTFKLSFPDPRHPERQIRVPAQGELALGPREMKMCPVGLAFAGYELRYSTAEALAQGEAGRHWLILYDEPGRLVEFALAVAGGREARIEGETIYHRWDGDSRSAVIGMRVGEEAKTLLVDSRLHILVLPSEQALHTWVAEFPREPGTKAGGKNGEVSVPFLSDAALLTASGRDSEGFWADLAFSPGRHTVTALVERKPGRILVNGADAQFAYDARRQAARIELEAPAIPARAVEIGEVETWVERFDSRLGDWIAAPLGPLEKLFPLPYGYVKYQRKFRWNGEPKLELAAFCNDGKQVFVNGKRLEGASRRKRHVEAALTGVAVPGENLLEIAYEAFGSPNFGPRIAELKGIESAALVSESGRAEIDGSWQIQRAPAAMRGRDVDPEFHAGGWRRAAVGGSGGGEEPRPVFCWCRAEFRLAATPARWQIPWKADFEAGCDALLYLNGRFVGRYAKVGPQTEFYLPDPYLRFGDEPNLLTVVLGYTGDAGAIRSLRIAPFEEFSLWSGRIDFRG